MISAIHYGAFLVVVIDPGQDDTVQPGLCQRDQLVYDLLGGADEGVAAPAGGQPHLHARVYFRRQVRIPAALFADDGLDRAEIAFF